MKPIFKDILTSKDGESYNFAKVAGVIILSIWLIISFIAVALYKISVDLNGWGGVTTAIYGAINAAIRATHITEPDK